MSGAHNSFISITLFSQSLEAKTPSWVPHLTVIKRKHSALHSWSLLCTKDIQLWAFHGHSREENSFLFLKSLLLRLYWERLLKVGWVLMAAPWVVKFNILSIIYVSCPVPWGGNGKVSFSCAHCLIKQISKQK